MNYHYFIQIIYPKPLSPNECPEKQFNEIIITNPQSLILGCYLDIQL